MPTAEAEVVPVEAPTVPRERPTTRPREETRTKTQPPYAVVLHNDDVNGFDFVIGVLRKVFNYRRLKAFWLTLKVHCSGCGVIWSGTLEVAELKADQVRSCGPDPAQKSRSAEALKVTVEALPG
jgi:ATP-dependent Clp protease adaptor protein ClpS